MKRVDITSEAVKGFLAQHRIPTLNIAGILDNEPRVEAFVDDETSPSGLLVKGPWFWYVHTESDAFLNLLFAEMEQKDAFYQFSGVWKPVADRIKARYGLVWDAPCDLYVLREGRQVQPRADSPATSVRLEDAGIIDEHYTYRNDHSLAKIQGCIANRPSSAIYVDSQLACWLLVHEDNSLGIMYTLEEHRRKGYALDVSLDLVAKQLQAGKTPFLQIRDDNAMSPGLALKCGFEPHGKCDWFGVCVGTPAELVEGDEAFRRRTSEAGWPEEGEVGLCRFLYSLPPDDSETNPWVEVSEEAWLSFDGNATLASAVAALRGSLRLLGEPGPDGLTATAALLVGEEDGFALLGCQDLDADSLARVLLRAKALDLEAAFVRVPRAAQARWEACGFRALKV